MKLQEHRLRGGFPKEKRYARRTRPASKGLAPRCKDFTGFTLIRQPPENMEGRCSSDLRYLLPSVLMGWVEFWPPKRGVALALLSVSACVCQDRQRRLCVVACNEKPR